MLGNGIAIWAEGDGLSSTSAEWCARLTLGGWRPIVGGFEARRRCGAPSRCSEKVTGAFFVFSSFPLAAQQIPAVARSCCRSKEVDRGGNPLVILEGSPEDGLSPRELSSGSLKTR
jgi:hypothetical protein